MSKFRGKLNEASREICKVKMVKKAKQTASAWKYRSLLQPRYLDNTQINFGFVRQNFA